MQAAFLNCAGRVGQALQELGGCCPALMLLAETHTTANRPLPVPAGWVAFQAPRPRGQGGGVAALAHSSTRAVAWRSRPADGVLWVQLPGALAGSRTWAVAVCYHRPPTRAAREEEEEAAGWYARLAAEWVEAEAAGWIPTVVGDLNARTAAAPDWPAWESGAPRRSADTQLDPRGRQLLQFCSDVGARIANGRVAGDLAGAVTSVGVSRAGRAVVDYLLLPAAHLPQVRELRVSEEAVVCDHSSLVFSMAAAARRPPAPETPGADPRLLRFPLPPSLERREAAAAALMASPSIPALTAAAERATSVAEVEAVALERCYMVAAACTSAGVGQASRGGGGGGGGRGAGSSSGIPTAIEQRFRLRPLRAAMRAARQQRGSPEYCEAHRALQRATRQARHAQREQRAVRLERQFLQEHDAAGFYQAYRGPRTALPGFVQEHPDAVFSHFSALLAPPQRAHPGPAAAGVAAAAAGAGARLEGLVERADGRPRLGRPPLHEALPGPPEGSTAAGALDVAGQQGQVHDQHTTAPAPGAAAVAAGLAPLADPPSPAPPPPPPAAAAAAARVAALRASMEAPFTPAEIATLAQRTSLRKSVVGPLAPWLLKPACGQLAPLISSELNAWRRVGRLPLGDASSSLALVPKPRKPGSGPPGPADLRGIAVGALLAKLYAAGLERRVSDHAEAAGVHAEGQFGFRRGRSTEQAVLALRTVAERYRLQRQQQQQRRRGGGGSRRSCQLWACFVDFKQAYDRVPRAQLWARLELMGYGGEWLRAVRAIYEDVPITIGAPGLEGRVIHATQGLKQGCPLSPTLFSLYIADFEQRVLAAAAQHGAALDLPLLVGSVVPPLMYADDMTLLATSAAGLQRQLRLLEQYSAERGLTVNLSKTEVLVLAGAATEEGALRMVERARLTFGDQRLQGSTQFKYLGVVFHCIHPLGESASAGRAAAARFAAAAFEGRCAEMGLEAARLLLILYSQMVDSTLSFAAAVWSPSLALAAARRPVVGGSGLSAAELQHCRSLRRLIGLPIRTPVATILAEAGEPPLYITWLVRAARFWSTAVAAPEGSLLRQVLDASLQMAAECQSGGVPVAQQPWAAQLQLAMAAAGVAFDPQQRAALCPDEVRQTALSQYLQRVAAAAAPDAGHSRLHHYFVRVRPSCLAPDGYSLPAYVTEVRERQWRLGLAELRSGVHWGQEERERLLGRAMRPREQRHCQHCQAAGRPGLVEDTYHMIFQCELYGDLRAAHPSLFPPGEEPTLGSFLSDPTAAHARFAGAIRRCGRAAIGLPP